MLMSGLLPVTCASDLMWCINSLVTVVMEAIVAAQRSQGTQADGIGEENLSACINPHLSQQNNQNTSQSVYYIS